MTTPTIKKYRRRVSDERVHKIQGKLMLPERIIRNVLEVDEREIQLHETLYENVISFSFVGDKMTYTVTKEQFHAEWEEIPND